jgi:HK97 family phage prohead protease
VETKQIAVELKATAGDLSAVFSTFNVPDHDHDVTLPGAFDDGAAVRLLPSHNWAHYMIGKGVIRSDAERAVFDGKFFLTTAEGRNWYESIKADRATGEPMQEWSYGFDVLDAEPGVWDGEPVRFLKKLKVHEVSPVTLGAGIGTTTLAVKSSDPLPDELRAAWTAAFVNTLPDSAFAYIEPGGDQDEEGKTVPRSLRHFPHHGSDGAVDLPHLRNALSRAPQSPLGDRALPHLKRHASAAGVGESADHDEHEHAADPAELPYAERLERALADVAGIATASQERLGIRAKEGRRLSAATRRHLSALMEQMHTIRGQLETLLAEDDTPDPKSVRPDLVAIRADLEQFTSRHRDILAV